MGTTSTRMPKGAQSSRSTATLPAAFLPKVKLSPQKTAFALYRPASTSVTKASGERSQNSSKAGSKKWSAPSSSMRRCFSSSVMSRPPFMAWPAGRLKVNTAASSPSARAQSTAAEMTARCPMCTPSKKPRATALPRPKAAGGRAVSRW